MMWIKNKKIDLYDTYKIRKSDTYEDIVIRVQWWVRSHYLGRDQEWPHNPKRSTYIYILLRIRTPA